MGSTDRKNGAGEDARDRTASDTSGRSKRTISGPGAADFLTATGGIDTPESDPAKGTRGLSDQPSLLDERRLTPDLDEPRDTTERERLTGDGTSDRPEKTRER